MKKNRIWIIGLILFVMSLACNFPVGSPPQTTPHPGSLPTPTAENIPHGPDLSEPTSTEKVMDEPPAAPAPDIPLAYGDRTSNPAQVVLLDPRDGSPIQRLDAPGLGWGGNGGVTADGIFYVDAAYQHAYHLAFDGSLQILDFLNPEGGTFSGVMLPSPDGRKIALGAVLSFDAEGARIQLKVVHRDGTGERILLDEIVEEERPIRPTPIKWSSDGQHLYYMHVIEGVEGFGGTDLYRIEIATGEEEMLFPDLNCLCSTAVSPDETKAVRFMQHGTPVLVIKDLLTGEEQFVSFPGQYLQAWDILWAPDSSALAVTLGLGNWEADRYSLVRVNLADLSQTFLITKDPRLLRGALWSVMDTIWLNDSDGNLWRMVSDGSGLTLTASEAWIIPPSE